MVEKGRLIWSNFFDVFEDFAGKHVKYLPFKHCVLSTSSTSQKHISTGTDQALTGLHQFTEQLTTDNSRTVLCCKLNAMKCVSCLLYSTRTFLSMDLFVAVGGLLFL